MFNAAAMPDILLALAESSGSDAVRLGAANSLLDRAGIKGGQDVNVTVTQGEDPSAVLSERMRKLRERVVDGEVVEDSAENAVLQVEGDMVIPEDHSPSPQED